jgi:hypothetical protein
MADRHSSLNEATRAAEEINDNFPGIGAHAIDHRDCSHDADRPCTWTENSEWYCDAYGDGIKIGIDCGDANEVCEIMNDPPQRVGFPGYGWVEAINGECVRLLISAEMNPEQAEAYRLGWQ